MKHLITALLISTTCLSAPNAYPQDESSDLFVAESARKPSVYFEMELYRVHGSVSGSFSLTDDIFQGIDSPTAEEKATFTYFTVADAQLGDVHLKVDEEGW